MKPTIEHPKVFISYAWGSKEYQERVLTLARDLVANGIDVLLDKWDLKEGNDKYSYMEQSVKDETVTNVLLLLDPIYAKKADERSGGVGTETQIISPEIYNNVKQDKFLPIVFERDEDGNIPKPQYLKSILHFDLSTADKYDDEYHRLVKRLYGIEVQAKPELGNIPKWAVEDIIISSSKRTKINSLKNMNPAERKAKFIELLNDAKSEIICFNPQTDDDCLLQYNEMKPLRDEYLQILKISQSIDSSEVLIGDILQELYYETQSCPFDLQDIKQTFLHEIYLYTVAFYYKSKDYKSLEYIINRTFFGRNTDGSTPELGYKIFYHHSEAIDFYMCQKDNKKYLCGTAQYWIDNLAADFCNSKEFAFADVLLCNYSFYGSNYHDIFPWFPITYIYDGEYYTILKEISQQLKSSEIAQRWMKVFGYNNIQEFKGKIVEVSKDRLSRPNSRPRYNATYHHAQLIGDFIKAEDIASLR